MANQNLTFAPGQRLGNYELLVEIASGGTATVGVAVYRGAAGFERLVVVKRVHRHLTKNPDFTAMLLDEARLASSIRHPNVVPVIDVVRQDDEVILVMDYVESVTLSQLGLSADRRVAPAIVSRILADVLVGLHEAHEAADIRRQPLGIVHRDVSPQNILVGVDGIARVIDFGIAKARSRLAHTRAGTIKGKCAYMAPEQVEGLGVDRRCDVFAAGIVLWEALTGARLFRGEDDFDEMRRVSRAPIPPPSSLAPHLGPDVDALLAHALARPLGDRFQTAQAFARALEHAIRPAPARDVGDAVLAACGQEIEYRYGRLLAILGDELEKLSPRPTSSAARATVGPPARAPASGGVAGVSSTAAARGGTLKIEHAPSPAPRTPRAPQPNLPMETMRSDAGVARDEPESPGAHEDGEVAGVPRRRSLGATLVLVAIVSVLAGGAIAFAVSHYAQ